MKLASLQFLIVGLALTACAGDPNVKELERAAQAVEQMVSPFEAPRTSFFVVLPNGTPKQFVSWFFSSMGTIDWPPAEGSTEFNQEELDALRRTGTVLRPKDVSYRHSNPDPTAGRQIVLKWNDDEGTVILEGYLDPSQSPVLSRSFKLPKNVVPDQMAKLTVQSNVEMGMAFQSF